MPHWAPPSTVRIVPVVDAEHLVVQLLCDVGELAVARGDPGVVDEHVDPAEVAVDALDQRLELVPVPDVACAPGCLDAVQAQPLDDLVAGVGLAADADDL